MNDKATSLDQLHDIVVPDSVSWWPLAPGWYFVGLVAIALLVVAAVRLWQHWQANAYRRIAIGELAQAKSVRDVSELLRRTALANVSRSELSPLTGEAWPDWLAQHCQTAMPLMVRSVLAESIYRPQDPADDLPSLKAYAADWIRGHQIDLPNRPVNANEVP